MVSMAEPLAHLVVERWHLLHLALALALPLARSLPLRVRGRPSTSPRGWRLHPEVVELLVLQGSDEVTRMSWVRDTGYTYCSNIRDTATAGLG